MAGPHRAITPDRYFIVLTNLLGGGVSSSPSNTPAPFESGRFPRITLYDNVRLQHMLLTKLGIERLRLVAGWSMGACQSLQWGAQYPDMVQALAALCGSARTANFNKVFLLSLRRALELDPAFADGSSRPRMMAAPAAGAPSPRSQQVGHGRRRRVVDVDRLLLRQRAVELRIGIDDLHHDLEAEILAGLLADILDRAIRGANMDQPHVFDVLRPDGGEPCDRLGAGEHPPAATPLSTRRRVITPPLAPIYAFGMGGSFDHLSAPTSQQSQEACHCPACAPASRVSLENVDLC
jgi:pimeloyl-ACP methyl ester carboxylesterase